LRTFLDSGVLLMAWRGSREDARLAITVMEDESRTFFSSQLVRLELVPKAAYFKRHDEVRFYESFFSKVNGKQTITPDFVMRAERLAARYGLSAIDALHIEAAIAQRVEEFITIEGKEKPMFRVKELNVRNLYSLAD
jgi:hypothetical protein